MRSFLVVVVALLAVCSASAQAIVGAWALGDPSIADSGSGVVVFLDNGYYFHVEDTSPDSGPWGYDGFERGSYAWNSGTGAFSVTALQDSNGDIGLSSLYSGATISVSGNTLTLTDADGPDTGSFQINRVTGAQAIVGAWALGDPSIANSGSGALVFLDNGYYFHVEDTSPGSGPSGFDGFERGTYLWTPGTGAFSVTALQDTNGDIGLSGLYSGALVSVSGNTLTLTDADGPGTGSFQIDRVTAIPEPSTYAALAGLLALGLVAWRRRLGQSRGSGSRTMSRAVLRLLLALGVSLSAHSLHGQFTFEGTDDFNDGVPALGSGLRWSGVFGSNTGTVAWTETNQRLEFTGSHGTATPSFSQYGWNSGADVTLFDDTSWTASIELSVPHVPTSGFVQGALIVSLVGGSGRTYGLYLYSGVGETKLTSVYTISNTPTVIDTDFISDVTDVELRLQWDATARTMTSSYRFSPLDAYTTSATLDVTGTLGFDPTGGFFINPSARAASGESVASGGLYFDNMSVTAIPEPSTYTAFAGLGALGLAFWRRRQAKLAA